jgi:hypothetical protein
MGFRARRALCIVALAVMFAACSSFATKGSMPPPGPHGVVEVSAAPEFIVAADRGSGVAGYARREDVLSGTDRAFPVYGYDLRTVVGQVVPGKGFIPVGVDPNTVPKIPVQVGPATQHSPDASKVALYVRNDSTSTANTAVVIDGTMTAGGGFWSQDIGVECDAMPPGAQLALLDRGISEPGASVVRVLYVRDDEPEAPSLWVVVGTSGAITTGRGVPSWWTGDPLC